MSDESPSNSARPFHRLFGLSWIDFFRGTDVVVETEVDLSAKLQLLDVVIIRPGATPLALTLPDGFEDLAKHNLITFKSYQEVLNEWTLWELIGHFVNYRKQSSASWNELLPLAEIRLYALTARFPQKMARQIPFTMKQEGVYDIEGLGLKIRVVVLGQLPEKDANAMLHLFSASERLLRFGREQYRPFSSESSTLLMNLIDTFEEDWICVTNFKSSSKKQELDCSEGN